MAGYFGKPEPFRLHRKRKRLQSPACKAFKKQQQNLWQNGQKSVRERRNFREKLLRQVTGPLLLSASIFYLSFHALSGERGLYALLKEERKLELIQGNLDDITAQRKDMEHKVRLMSAGSLDLDLLDEQSRIMLDNAAEDEVVLPMPKAPTKPNDN